MCTISMDMDIMLGPHQFSLQAVIDHHISHICIRLIILPLSTVAKKNCDENRITECEMIDTKIPKDIYSNL